jgi:cytochrome c oxidase subunit II
MWPPPQHPLRMPAPVRRKLLFACLSLAALALVLAGAAAAGNGGVAPPAETPQAHRIQDIYWVLLGVTGVIFVLVEGALILFVARFRNAGRPRDAEGPQIRGHTRLELLWTAIPVLILAGIITVVFYKLPGIQDIPAATSDGSSKMTINVEGRQFYWRYVYPNGAVSINELRLPVGTPVKLVITAPTTDVNHSWWVPSLAGKMDAIPGKTNHLEFVSPSSPGVFVGQCAEFCGIQHAMMLTRVRVVEPSEYRAYLATQLQVNADVGRMTFEGACAPCHGMKGEGLIGPSLQGNSTLADPQRLKDLLENGKGKMPPVGKDWSQHELAALQSYLKETFAGGG